MSWLGFNNNHKNEIAAKNLKLQRARQVNSLRRAFPYIRQIYSASDVAWEIPLQQAMGSDGSMPGRVSASLNVELLADFPKSRPVLRISGDTSKYNTNINFINFDGTITNHQQILSWNENNDLGMVMSTIYRELRSSVGSSSNNNNSNNNNYPQPQHIIQQQQQQRTPPGSYPNINQPYNPYGPPTSIPPAPIPTVNNNNNNNTINPYGPNSFRQPLSNGPLSQMPNNHNHINHNTGIIPPSYAETERRSLDEGRESMNSTIERRSSLPLPDSSTTESPRTAALRRKSTDGLSHMPIPEIPHSFPEIECMSSEEIDHILANKEAYDVFFNQMSSVEFMNDLLVNTRMSNKDSVEENITMEEEVLTLRAELMGMKMTLQETLSDYETLVKENGGINKGDGGNIHQVLDELTEKITEEEEISENIGMNFRDGDITINDFLKDYIEHRKLYHLRQAKHEKLQLQYAPNRR